MRIDRPRLIRALHDFVRGGSGVIIGQPGAGKSVALTQLAEQLEAEGQPYLLILVDELGDVSERDIKDALGYPESRFRDALQSLFASGSQGGSVIFDGFDAARSPMVRSRLLKVIRTAVREAPPEWSVVVSVRTYDAAKSPTLLEIFPRSGREKGPYRSSLVARHFVVPELTEPEMASALESSAPLRELLRVGSEDLRELVKNPFNLWLLENVLKADSTPDDVSVLSSQTALLLLFWDVRVRRGPLADDRTMLLKEIIDLMISGRVMVLQKGAVIDSSAREAWETLHSTGILKEAGPAGDRVAFAHHILFDFAVSILAIEDSASQVASFLREDVSRPLFLRPSLLHYFVRLWVKQRDEFWRIFWTLLPSDEVPIRLVIRLLPPYVAVSEASSPKDFAPLVERLKKGDPIATSATLRVLQALKFVGTNNVALWTSVFDQLAETPSRLFAWEMAHSLRELAEKEQPGDASVGGVAIKLFDWAWSHRNDTDGTWYDHLASTLILPTLLHRGQVSAVERVVPPILDLLAEAGFPIRYFNTLSDNASRLASIAPALAEEVYQRIFLHDEVSNERTPFGSAVVPMQSTRRQDFQLCHYQLEQEYPAYLDAHPESAIRVAFRLLDLLLQREVKTWRAERLEDSAFVVRTGEAQLRLLADFGDEWLPNREEVKRMADRAQARLEADLGAPRPLEWIAFFQTLRCTSTWSRVFMIGAAQPAAFAEPLSQIAVDLEFLRRATARKGLIRFIENSYQSWPQNRRRAFEGVILTDARLAEHELWQAALLRAIPGPGIVLEKTRIAKNSLDNELAQPSQPDEKTRASVRAGVGGRRNELETEGAGPSDQDTPQWRDAADRLTDFSSNWHNKEPGEAEVMEILDDLRGLWEALPAESEDGEPLVQQGWTALAGAAETASRLDSAQQGPTGRLLREILLEALQIFAPSAPQEAEEYTFISWSPSPRIAAAQGLPRLLSSSPDREVESALEKLLESRSPSERAVTLLSLPHSHKQNQAWFAEQVRKAAANETSPGVVQAVFRALTYVKTGRDETARDLISRWLEACGDHHGLRMTIGDWLTYLSFQRDDAAARALLHSLMRQAPLAGADLLGGVVVQALHLLSVDRFSAEDPAVVDRVIDWATSLVDALREELVNASDESLKSWLPVAHELIDRVVSRIYFNLKTTDEAASANFQEARREYYSAIQPILTAVVEFAGENKSRGMVPSTAHYFVQMMNEVLPFEPKRALAMTRAVALAAGPHGYKSDSLAVKEVVKLVEALLADHREVLLDAEALDDLLGLLDQFAEVGWPEALQLVWRLDEIFR